jgi:hypothetical protein
VFIDRKGIAQVQYAGDADFFKNEEVNMKNQIEAMLKGTPVARAGAAKKSSK